MKSVEIRRAKMKDRENQRERERKAEKEDYEKRKLLIKSIIIWQHIWFICKVV